MRYLLILNTGSSSVKFCVFGLASELPMVAEGRVTNIGNTPNFKACRKDEPSVTEDLPPATTHADAVRFILKWLAGLGISVANVKAVAHRIVHGGDRFNGPVLIDDGVMTYLRSLMPVAPLHQPHNLAGIDILAKEMPNAVQYGCFDTAFHASHDELHYTFALPEKMRSQGVRRYGFHGLSYSWVAEQLKRAYPHLVEKRVVVAHLGNGASLCAMKDGRSIDTTMGMTALDGLPMGTRSGGIDAGAVIYMIRELGLGADKVEKILYGESGLKGLSGLTNDVKALSESSDPRAAFALDYFCHKTAQYIAAMAVSLGGLDALIFTGGIGENAAPLRQNIVKRLGFLPTFETHIIAANEERGMAEDIWNTFAKEMAS